MVVEVGGYSSNADGGWLGCVLVTVEVGMGIMSFLKAYNMMCASN